MNQDSPLIKTPAYLEKGDAIELIAPSFGCTTEPYSTRLDASINRLRKEGYRIKEGRNVRLSEGIVASSSPENRAKEFMDAYLAEDSKLILSVGGGELMAEMLPHINFEKIKWANPKWFMGFSDNANLTFLLPILANVKAIYGPNAPSFYEKPFRFAQLDALNLLKGEKETKGYPKFYGRSNKDWPALYKPRANREKVIVPLSYDKPVEGMLLGGCLDVLRGLCGTKFDKVREFASKQEGVIWFFESCDLSPLDIRRALFQLDQAGWFANAKMFLLGRHLCENWLHNDFMGINPHTASSLILGEKRLPMLLDIDLGHIGPSMPLIEGAKAKVEYKENNIFVSYLEKE
ncbi:MAG: LD-carboxypeptidase [Bacilli bacterium]|nr:LD-carboxypeptidase [Bacilli bacterium]